MTDRLTPQREADVFNARFPVGTPVFAYPGFRPEDDRNATRLVTRTRSKASVFGDAPVVMVDGYERINLTHVDVISEDEFKEARAAETPAAPSPADAPVQLDDQRLAEALAAYEGHPDLGFACCTAHAVADHVPALLAEVQRLKAERHSTNEALSDAAEALRDMRDRLAKHERPAIEAKRREIRQSFTELIAQCEQDRDHEGAFDVQCQLRDREEQWKREDEGVTR